MSLKLMNRPRVVPAYEIDSPEDIADMMAEAARVDAMFQSGTISTLLPYAFCSDELQPVEPAREADKAESSPKLR